MSTYESIIQSVDRGARFHVDLKKRSIMVGGEYVVKDGRCDDNIPSMTMEECVAELNRLYEEYYNSVPSERSENKYRRYFSAKPLEELTDEDMWCNKRRDVCQAALETFLCLSLINGSFHIDDEKYFWQSEQHPSFVILRDFIQ